MGFELESSQWYSKHSCLPSHPPNPLPQFLIPIIFSCVPLYTVTGTTAFAWPSDYVIGADSLFPQYESWGWNSSRQPWQLGTLPAQPSHWLYTMDWKDDESWRVWTTRGMTHWVCGFGWSLQCELGLELDHSIGLKALERNKHWGVHLSRTDTCHLFPSHGHYVQTYSWSSVPPPWT